MDGTRLSLTPIDASRARGFPVPQRDWIRAATITTVIAVLVLCVGVVLAPQSASATTGLVLLAALGSGQIGAPYGRLLYICGAAVIVIAALRLPDSEYLLLAPMLVIAGEGMIRIRIRLDEAEQAANVDALTDALTPRGFARMLAEELPLARHDRRTTALVYVDLDHFKRINDRYGHEAGDRTLAELVAQLRGRLLSDDHIARLGGDEFMVFLRYADDDSDLDRFQRILAESIAAMPYPVTASVGGLILPPGAYGDPLTLVYEADRLMYDVKNAGRGSCKFDRYQRAA